MREERKRALMIGRRMGAVVGGIIFLVFGIVPGFYFGSYATVVLLNHLFGPIEPSIIVRMLVVVGTIMGLFCTAAVSIVVGAVAGTLLAYAVDAIAEAAKAKPKVKEAQSTVHNR